MTKSTKLQFLFSKVAWLLVLLPVFSFGQALTGSKTIPGTYPNITNALADLNANGVGPGGVTFNINAGYTEAIDSAFSVTVTGTAGNPIVFRKDPATTGSNPLITANPGQYRDSSITRVDGMWRFIGSDYITIEGIDLLDPASNNTPLTAMEYGYGFYKKSSVDGANNNTIRNCTITLNRNNVFASIGARGIAGGSVGIEFVMVHPDSLGKTMAVTSLSGASSNNKIYNNTIQNCNIGIFMNGFSAAFPYTFSDMNNDIGGSSSLTGNTIINFGGGTGATVPCAAVAIQNQWSFNFSYNTVNNNTGIGVNHPFTNRGIWLHASSIGASGNVNNNSLTILGGTNVGQADYGIDCETATGGITGGNTINLNNNTISMTKSVLSSAIFTAIFITSFAETINVNGNKIINFTYAGTGVSECILSQTTAVGTLNIMYNSLNGVVLSGPTGSHYNIAVTQGPSTALNIVGDSTNGVTLSGVTSKVFRGIFVTSPSPQAGDFTISDNVFKNISWSGGTPTGQFGLIWAIGGSGIRSYIISNNSVLGALTIPTTGIVYLINNNTSAEKIVVKNNNLTGNGITRTASGTTATYGYFTDLGDGPLTFMDNVISNVRMTNAGYTGKFYGMYGLSVHSAMIKNNTISDISSVSAQLYGLYLIVGSKGSAVSNNMITNLTANNAIVYGINIGQVELNLNNNILDSLSGSNAYGLYITAQRPCNVYNNKVSRVSANGEAAGIFTSTNEIIFSNNIIGDIRANGDLYGIKIAEGTNTIKFYNNTVYLNAINSTPNFISSCIYFGTNARLTLNNNIMVNLSASSGTGGYVCVFRRNGSGTYDITSNKNLFYAGNLTGASVGRYLFHDGITADSLLSTYKTRVTPADAESFTENVTFQSTVGNTSNYLMADTTIATLIESNALPITSLGVISTDYNGKVRQGYSGYIGVGIAPDIGPYEANYSGIAMTYDSCNTDQIIDPVSAGRTNQAVLRIRIYTVNPLSVLTTTRIRLNTAGTTSIADISNAKVFYTGSRDAFDSSSQFGSTIASPSGSFVVTGSQVLKQGVNYFWLTYDIAAAANTPNVVDGRFDSIMLNGVNRIPITNNPTGGTNIGRPLAGIYNIGTAPYFTLAAAVADLSVHGIMAPVTINVPAGYSEQAPVGGYKLGSARLNSSLNSSNRLSIVKSGSGLNPILYANAGIGTIDGIFYVLGADFVTINGLNLIDTNTLNSTVKMERGFGLFNLNGAAPFDGCQHDTIMNCTVKLTKENAIGIEVNGALYNDPVAREFLNYYTVKTFTITQPSDAHSYNVIVNDSFQNIHTGIFFKGYTATENHSLYDEFNFVTANVFEQISSVGINMQDNADNQIVNNRIELSAGTGALGIFNGFTNDGAASPHRASNLICSGNYVKGIANGTTTAITSLYFYYLRGNSTITDNTIQWATVAPTTCAFTGLEYYFCQDGPLVQIKNNRIDSTSLNTTGEIIGYRLSTPGTICDVSNNSMINVKRTSQIISSAVMSGMRYHLTSGPIGNVTNVHDNIIDSISNGNSTGDVYGIYLVNKANTMNIYKNKISMAGASGTGSMYGVYVTEQSGNINVYGNLIDSLLYASNIYGIYSANTKAENQNIYNNVVSRIITTGIGKSAHAIYLTYPGNNSCTINNNKISNIYANGSGTTSVNGIYVQQSSSTSSAKTPVKIFNNLISDLRAPFSSITTASAPSVVGLNFNYSSYSYTGFACNNTINLSGNGGANATSVGILMASLIPDITLSNNIVVNNINHSGTGFATAICRNGSSLSSYNKNSDNNLLYAGLPSPKNLIYVDAAALIKVQTLQDFKIKLSPAEYNSVTENPLFIATSITSPSFLMPDLTTGTNIESGGKYIPEITKDASDSIRFGNPGYIGSGTNLDIGGYERDFIYNDSLAPSIYFTPFSNIVATGNRTVVANITDRTGVSLLSNPPTLYYKKSMTGTYSPSSGTRISGSSKNGNWSFDILASNMSGLITGDTVFYFIVAQDSSSNNNLASMPLGAVGLNVASLSSQPTPYSYKIVSAMAGNYTVGAGGNYWNLTNPGGAFDAINNASLTGNVTLTVTSDLNESGAVALKKWSESGVGNYKVRIVPNNAIEKQIVDTSSIGALNGIITFDGTKNVTVDGRFNGTGKFLRFRNRGTTGIAFHFMNDAIHDTIMYSTLECASTASGTILFGLSDVINGRGNDSNVIIFNNIGDTLDAVAPMGAPNYAISNEGMYGMENDANVISNNNIYNFNLSGINLTATGTGDYWTIANNKIYQTANRTTGPQYLINLLGGGGHIVRNNSIGGGSPNRSGLSMYTSNTLYAIYASAATQIPMTIDSNIISNISGSSVYGIYVSTHATVNRNVIGGLQFAWDSIVIFTNGMFSGIYTLGTKDIAVTNNIIGNVTFIGVGNAAIAGIYATSIGSTTNIFSNNTIRDFSGTTNGRFWLSTSATFCTTGIYIFPADASGGLYAIDKNTIYNLSSSSSGFVSGIYLAGTYTSVNVSRNTIYGLASASGIVAGIFGPVRVYNSATSKINVYNNQISINNPGRGLTVGIDDRNVFTGLSKTNYFMNNSVFVGGAVDILSTENSYAFYRFAADFGGYKADSLDIWNNIFYNNRTGGTGKHYAIGYRDGAKVTPLTINYNLMVTRNPNELIELPGEVSTSISGFNAQYTTRYNSNWMAGSNTVAPQSLFVDTSTANLSIVTTNSNCWYTNGKGIALASVSTDFAGNPRSTTIAGGATDLGAFEFTTSTVPPSATASGTPALNGVTNYTFGGKTIASVSWGAAGTVPSSVDVKYYTGTNAPSLVAGKTRTNAYYAITPTGGSGYTYNLTMSYDSSMMGTVSSTANLKMARYQPTGWTLLSSGTANGVTGILSSGSFSAGTTLNANFTGTDNLNNPLPVELLKLNATRMKSDVLVAWATASEYNSSLFEVERSFDGNSFEWAGSVSAGGYSSKGLSYRYNDVEIVSQTNANAIFYRLKMIDADGSFEYSKIVVVNLFKEDGKDESIVFPNPFTNDSYLTLNLSVPAKVKTIIMDITGRIVSEDMRQLDKGSQTIRLTTDSLKPGIYFVSLEFKGTISTHKIIKY